jgi:hypothetical protein
VDLVEEPRWCRRQFSVEDGPAMLSDIEVQIRFRVGDNQLSQLCLAYLPWPADKDHFAAEIALDLCLKIPGKQSHVSSAKSICG